MRRSAAREPDEGYAAILKVVEADEGLSEIPRAMVDDEIDRMAQTSSTSSSDIKAWV